MTGKVPSGNFNDKTTSRKIVIKKQFKAMKQPELGRKIAGLRTAKGLTQEELVERCNISVRTIQRIEAGEVMPRSYTVRTILAALDCDLSKMSDNEAGVFNRLSDGIKSILLIDLSYDAPSASLQKSLNLAWIMGIVYVLAGFFEGATEYYLFTEKKLIVSKGAYVAIKAVSLASFIVFQRGFILIGGIFRNYLLKIISVILVFAMIMLSGYDIVTIFSDSAPDEYIAGASALTFGIFGIIFGISLLRLQRSVGSSATVAGILEITGGCFLLTVILAFIGLIIYLPAEIVEIILIFKVLEIIKARQEEGTEPFNRQTD